jgi:AcrR family transcriptional regulator
MTMMMHMARPREFDREAALQQAMLVFWAKGYAGTSTEDLVQAMGIGRQSLYNSFGDKWQLYVQALTDYQQRSTSAHIARLQAPASALEGIRDMLQGLVSTDDNLRALGCMGVGAACEFGASEPEVANLRARSATYLRAKLAERVREGQSTGEIDPELDAQEAASYLLMSMTGIQLAARGGAKPQELRRLAQFAAERLEAH